jgi:hypothetical protein
MWRFILFLVAIGGIVYFLSDREDTPFRIAFLDGSEEKFHYFKSKDEAEKAWKQYIKKYKYVDLMQKIHIEGKGNDWKELRYDKGTAKA